jgi:predicted transcriptional regulator
MCEVLGYSNMPATSFPMKKKTSITLSPEVLAQVDKLAGPKHSRSAVIEQSLRRFWDSGARAGTELRGLELIKDAADRLNTEAAEVLDYA